MPDMQPPDIGLELPLVDSLSASSADAMWTTFEGCFFIALASLIGYAVVQKVFNPLRKIPGPKGFPFIGSIFDVNWSTLHFQFDEWQARYGPVFRFVMLGESVIVLSSAEVAREALITRGTDFAGRPSMWRAQKIAHFKNAAFESYTKATIEKRKLLHSALGTHGNGLGRLESILTQGLAEFLDEISRKEGSPFDARSTTAAFICNVMATVMYGEEFPYDDPVIKDVLAMNDSILINMARTSPGKELDFFPWLRFTGLFKEGTRTLKKSEELRDSFLARRVKEARATLDESNPRGSLDHFILAKREGDSGDATMWDDHDLIGSSIDIITGGVSTSLRAMQAAYLILLKVPGEQEKLQKEIDRVIGQGRLPCLKDRESMPYTEAFVMELLRYISHIPFSLPKMTLTDTTVAGYKIPANTTVIINNWGIHHDQKIYPEPFKFSPQRFLAEDGTLHPPSHPVRSSFLVFGGGRRACPGEHLGLTRLFLLITSLLQRFTLMEDKDSPAPDADPRTFTLDTVLNPPDYTLCAVPRS